MATVTCPAVSIRVSIHIPLGLALDPQDHSLIRLGTSQANLCAPCQTSCSLLTPEVSNYTDNSQHPLNEIPNFVMCAPERDCASNCIIYSRDEIYTALQVSLLVHSSSMVFLCS